MREDFAKFGADKNQWVSIDKQTIDPELAQNIMNLIDASYKSIGGHVWFRSANDILQAFANNEIQVIRALDVDEIPDADAAIISTPQQFGNKANASAAKPGAAAKALMSQRVQDYASPGNYGEVSGKMAAALLGAPTKINVVQDKETVEKVLRQPVVWYGEYPGEEGLPPHIIERFKQYRGWYGRQLADGQIHVKIMVGMPNL